jgi:hypothetical protein
MTIGAPKGIQVDERERITSKAIRNLAYAARTLLECELAMKAHPDSSVVISRQRAEESLSDFGVTWDPLRGWVCAIPLSKIDAQRIISE